MTNTPASLGGVFRPARTSISVHRFGYGAMQLTGEMAYGPPESRDEAIAVLREAVELGIDHIDTSDYYGPHIANEIIREALHPYPDHLVIATKVGSRREPDRSWPVALSKRELVSAVHDNLTRLGLAAMKIVNLRVGGPFGPDPKQAIEEPLTVLTELKAKGLIEHIGLSNISPSQYAEARRITDIACVQNHYNLMHRGDDAFIDQLAADGVAYVPFFPLGGGYRPMTSPVLDEVAASAGATPRQVALAWLLQRSPNMLVIAGTSSVKHLRDNVAAASLQLSPEAVAKLDAIPTPPAAGPR